MSELWRRKKYYTPRVLIPVSDVTTPPLDDCLVCLEGHELLILRNLLQYAHYRSTWVSEYHDVYYLAPSQTEWDTLEAIVADLEYKLMNCDAFTQQLEDILDAAECACKAASGIYSSPATAGMIQDYVTDGDLQYTDYFRDGTSSTSTERCAIAQLAWAHAWEWLTEFIQPIQENSVDVLLPIAMNALAVMVGGPFAALPASALWAACTGIIDAWVEGQLTNVQNAVVTAKQELVCAIYNALDVGDFQDAADACYDVISDISGLTYLDKVSLIQLFKPWAFKAVQTAYSNNTTWAQNNVTANYCVACATAYPFSHEWYLPPHTDWVLSAERSQWTAQGWLHCWRGNGAGQSPTWAIPYSATVNYRVTIEYKAQGTTQRGHITIRQKATDSNWFSLPVTDTDHNLMGTSDAWVTQQFTGTVALAQPYGRMQPWGYNTDDNGIYVRYVKVEFWPT